jgi:hypothetical protein
LETKNGKRGREETKKEGKLNKNEEKRDGKIEAPDRKKRNIKENKKERST